VKTLVISQTVGGVEGDLQALRYQGYDRGTLEVASIYDGVFDPNSTGVPNLFALLEHGRASKFQRILIGLSVGIPSSCWLGAVLATFAFASHDVEVLLPPPKSRPEWSRHRAHFQLEPEVSWLTGADLRRTAGEPWLAMVRVLLDLLSRVRSGELPSFKESELIYLFHGGARRGYICNLVVGRLLEPSAGRYAMIDHGAALGLVSSNMALLNPSIASIRAVEFSPKFVAQGPVVARSVFGDGRVDFVCSSAEDYEYDATYDIIGFVHMLFRVPVAQRGAVLDRAWERVRPGGLVLINELVSSPAAGATQYATPLMTRKELSDFLWRFGEPQLFTGSTNWSEPEPLDDFDLSKWSGDHIVTVRKEE
jgi:hypothetical protein